MERCRKYPHTTFSVPLSNMGKRHHLNRQRENRVSDNGDNPLSDSLFLVVSNVHMIVVLSEIL